MADNYLERKMEEYRSGKAAAPRRRVIPSGAPRPQVCVPLGEITVMIAGCDEALVKAFASSGARVRFCSDCCEVRQGRMIAERWGARFIPYSLERAMEQPGDAVDYIVERSSDGVSVRSTASGIAREITVTPQGDTDTAAATDTLAVLMCTPLFSAAAFSVVEK